jgi:ATP-dependent DNA ligase
MMFRYPDKPMRISLDELCEPRYHDGTWVAQVKADGWRALPESDEQGQFPQIVSRQNKVMAVSQEILDALGAVGVPPNSTLDGEWMKFRAGSTERLYLFDVMKLGGVWRGADTYEERRKWLYDVDWAATSGLIQTPKETTTNILEFLLECMEDEDAEGIVLKKLTSRLQGKFNVCGVNPLWIKVKWRDGADGQHIMFTEEDVRSKIALVA